MPDPAPILIVDDDRLTRKLLCRGLEEAGFDAVECKDGMEALQAIEGTGASLLVLDYEMPVLNGAQICELIRSNPRAELAQTPIILLTGHSNAEHELECLGAGANDFVTKPVNAAVLRARIETHLRLHDLRRQLQEQNRELEKWRANQELDLEAARLTQHAILPARLPKLAGWDFAAHYRPLIQVGGDIYDWLPLANGSLLVWIADATGHGASAALITTLTKWLFRNAIADELTPAAILRSVHENFYAVFKGKSFMTAACCVLASNTSRVTFCGAGHPPLLIARADGTIQALASASPPLGLDGVAIVEESAADLHRGDALLLYTDGLYGVTNAAGSRSTPDEMRSLIAPAAGNAADFLTDVVKAVTSHAGEEPFQDDVAVFAAVRRD